MARASDGTDVPVSLPYLLPLRKWVLLTALFLTSKEEDTVPVRWRRKSTKCLYKLRSCRYSHRASPGSKFASQAFSHTVASYDAKISNIEQMVSSLAAGASTLETNATSVSSGSGSASSWNTLGHGDGSTVTGTLLSHGGHLMTIEIQDEGLIRSQTPKVNNHEVPFYYCSLANKTTKEFSSGSVIFGRNPICQQTTKMMVSPVQLTVPSAAPI